MTAPQAPQTPYTYGPPPPQPQSKNGPGTTALVLGIIAVVFAFIPLVGLFIAIPLALLALVFGGVGIHRVTKRTATNKGAAISGTACGGFAFVLTIVMTAAVFGGASGPASTPVTSGDSSSQGNASPSEAGIGDTVTDGNFAFTVTDVSEAQSIGEGFLATEAQGKYVLVELEVRNIGNEAATFNAGPSQTAYDAQGREYATSEDAIMSGNASDQRSFLQQINPGSSVQGRLVYDVPEATKLVRVHLQGGTFSPGAEVTLE